MRDPEYVRRYVHNLSSGRAAREASELAFQKYYVTHQGGLYASRALSARLPRDARV
jgi:hypothetical protein